MLTKTKILWFLLIVNFPSSLLQSLYQEAGSILTKDVLTSKTNNLLVLGDNNEGINEIGHSVLNNSKVNEIIQQIDVKDVQDQVISKINNVIVNNESESLIPNVKPDINSKNNSLNLRNVDNNVDLNKTVIPNVNATIIIDNDNNTLNDSTPLLYYNPKNGSILTNDTGTKETKADNVTVLRGVNASANKSEEINQRIDVKNNSSIGVKNETFNNISSVGNDSATNIVNQTYITVPNDVKNSTKFITNLNDVHNSPKSVVPTNNNTTNSSHGIETIHLNDKNDIAWRSVIPAKKKKDGKVQDVIKLKIQNVSLEGKSLKDIKANENNVSIEGVKNKNDSTILNDAVIETATIINNYTEAANTKLPLNINNPITNSKENVSSISDISLNTNNSSNITNELEPNNTGIFNNYTSSINVNNTHTDIAWKSDIPERKNKSSVKDNIKTESKKKTPEKNLRSSNISSLENTTKNPTLPISPNILTNNHENQYSKNGVVPGNEENIFMIVNSGNIEGFRANLPVVSNNPSKNQIIDTVIKKHGQINKDNFNTNDSKLLDKIINSTINNIATNILDGNFGNIKSKNVFLILNSGSISNFKINSPVFDVPKNDSLEIDRSVKSPSNSNKDINDKSETLKHSIVKSNNPIVDIKFRNGVNKVTNNTENTNYNSTITKPLNIAMINQSLKENPTEINDFQSNIAVGESLLDEKDISSPENIAFRYLLPLKKRTSLETVLPTNSDSIKSLPESESNKRFDFDNLNLFGNAFDLIKRLKRSSNTIKDDPRYLWEGNKNAVAINDISDELNVSQNGKPCSDSTCLDNDLLLRLLKTTRRAISNGEIVVSSRLATEELECPLSMFLKLALHQLFYKLSNSESAFINHIYPIISSLLDGNTEPINLATHLLWDQPFPVKLRIQLLHGDTSDFFTELTKYLDKALCKLQVKL